MPEPALRLALAPRQGWEDMEAHQVLQLALAPWLDLVASVDWAPPLALPVVPVEGVAHSGTVLMPQLALALWDPAPQSLVVR